MRKQRNVIAEPFEHAAEERELLEHWNFNGPIRVKAQDREPRQVAVGDATDITMGRSHAGGFKLGQFDADGRF